jgi:hypothetical protein
MGQLQGCVIGRRTAAFDVLAKIAAIVADRGARRALGAAVRECQR